MSPSPVYLVRLSILFLSPLPFLASHDAMKLKEIHRTSTFAWSPLPSLPLLATGTVAGALDESFSNNGQLEIWAPDFLNKDEYDLGEEGQTAAKASVTTTSRYVCSARHPFECSLIYLQDSTASCGVTLMAAVTWVCW